MKYLFLLLFCVCQVASANNFLKLYVFPTPYSYDWTTPQQLAKSVIKNSILPSKYNYKASIGHVAVELKCGDQFYALTGMSAKDKTENNRRVLKDKIGLGIMYYPIEGTLQTADQLNQDIAERLGSKDISWIQYQINELTCHRLKTYLTIYRNENLDRVYGLVFNPRKKEGAGCSAFAVSFLEIAGLLTEEHRLNWSRHLFTPKDLNAYNGSANEVSIFSMARGKNSKQWANNSIDGLEIFFWEPNSMHHWIKKTVQNEQERNPGVYKIQQVGKSVGLFYDARLTIPDLGPLFY